VTREEPIFCANFLAEVSQGPVLELRYVTTAECSIGAPSAGMDPPERWMRAACFLSLEQYDYVYTEDFEEHLPYLEHHSYLYSPARPSQIGYPSEELNPPVFLDVESVLRDPPAFNSPPVVCDQVAPAPRAA
jgi:hypothetical protein